MPNSKAEVETIRNHLLNDQKMSKENIVVILNPEEVHLDDWFSKLKNILKANSILPKP